jgi:carbon-monoxide dehydrogenase medium subunit
LEEAIHILSSTQGQVKILAGGTDLLVQVETGRLQVDVVLDIKRIACLSGIMRSADGGFTIGAATPLAAIVEDRALAAAWPGLVEAAALIGSLQVQGRATLAGNLCNASPAADGVPALIAADATVSVIGPKGRREIAVAEMPLGPGRIALSSDELVEAIRLPPRRRRAADAYRRLAPRSEMDIGIVGCGANLRLAEDGTVAEARVALSAVAPTARLVTEANSLLVGRRLDETTLAALAAAAEGTCHAIDDMRGSAAYRTRMAGEFARRVAVIAYRRAEEIRR